MSYFWKGTFDKSAQFWEDKACSESQVRITSLQSFKEFSRCILNNHLLFSINDFWKWPGPNYVYVGIL